MSAALERRARQVRARSLTRSWEYRQRHHAKGTWHRLRCLLAHAEHAYAVDEHVAKTLIEEGHEASAVGSELEPNKVILTVSPERLALIKGAVPVPIRIGTELLATQFLVLVRFTAG